MVRKRNRTFKDEGMQRVYIRYRGYHRVRSPEIEGRNGLEAGYRRGFLWPDKQQYDCSSLAYAAWAAGVDDNRQQPAAEDVDTELANRRLNDQP